MAKRSVVGTCAAVALASACLSVGVLATSARGVDRGPAPQQSDSGAPEVSLGLGKAVRGEPVVLSLIVFQESVKVVKTISEITFPTGVLSFEGIERSPDQDPTLQIEAAVVPESKGKKQEILKVEVTSGRGQALPEGTLVKLKFRVSPDASGGVVDVKHTAQVVTVGGEQIAAAAKDSQIQVSEVAVYSCFFYMH